VKKTNVLTSLKLVIAISLLVISGIIVFGTRNLNLASNTRAAEAPTYTNCGTKCGGIADAGEKKSCEDDCNKSNEQKRQAYEKAKAEEEKNGTGGTGGTSVSRNADCNTYTDESRCTNPPAKVTCKKKCVSCPDNDCVAECDKCPTSPGGVEPTGTGRKTCNTFTDTNNSHSPKCSDGNWKVCKLNCTTCSGTNGTDCVVECGGCRTGQPTVPVEDPNNPVPTAGSDPIADPGDWAAHPGKNCQYSGSDRCSGVSFNGSGSPSTGKMMCCRNLDADGYGTAEECDQQCGASCAGKNGGTHRDSGCGNPYTCPTFTPAPTKPCGNYVDTYCKTSTAPNCVVSKVTRNECTDAVISQEDTAEKCDCGTQPTPPKPTKTPGGQTTPFPTSTPNLTPVSQVGTCTSLSVSLEKGGSVNVNSASANNVLPRTPEPGEKMTLNSTAGVGSAFTIYWIKPLNAPNEYVPAEKQYTKASGCSFYILNPDGQPPQVSNTFTMPDWKSAPLHRNDSYGKTTCQDVAINFDAGVIIGTNYLPDGVSFGNANWCRNVGPKTTDAILHHGVENLGTSCNTVCVAVAQPQTPTKTPQQSTCSETCDDTTNPCATGLQCITATNGQKYCSQPGQVEACKAAPSATACCTEPTPTTPASPTPTPPPNECGYTPCDNATAPCKEGLTCVSADNGQKYCAKPALTEQCGENPSTTSCCTETTPTPIPTKKPAAIKCGEVCDEQNGKVCGTGMTCVQSENGNYCAMDKYTEACSEMGTYDACCKAPVTVQCGESCGTNNRICQPGYTCTDYGSGQVCAKNSLMPQCTEASTSNAKTDCCTEVTPTPPPTYTPYPSPTPYPTFTPLPPPPQQVVQQQQQVQYVQQVQPTYTPIPPPPTYTVIPTYTQFPTQPPQATYTPVPPPPRSGNPIPFVVAGVPIVLLILGMLL
jgi:hypothetical protein